MNPYRKIYRILLDAKFHMKKFKPDTHNADKFLAMQSLNEAIILTDTLAGELEQDKHNIVVQYLQNQPDRSNDSKVA